jgi:hypothetical protein
LPSAVSSVTPGSDRRVTSSNRRITLPDSFYLAFRPDCPFASMPHSVACAISLQNNRSKGRIKGKPSLPRCFSPCKRWKPGGLLLPGLCRR